MEQSDWWREMYILPYFTSKCLQGHIWSVKDGEDDSRPIAVSLKYSAWKIEIKQRHATWTFLKIDVQHPPLPKSYPFQ